MKRAVNEGGELCQRNGFPEEGDRAGLPIVYARRAKTGNVRSIGRSLVFALVSLLSMLAPGLSGAFGQTPPPTQTSKTDSPSPVPVDSPPPPPPVPPPVPPVPPVPAGGGKTVLPLTAAYSDGFSLGNSASAVELKIAASAQLDGRFYHGTAGDPSGFDIRRARLDLNAKLFQVADVRIQAALEDQAYVRNAFVDFNIHKSLRLRAGQMKVPFSTQWLSLDNQVDFMERYIAEPLHPFFDRGVMLWGNLLDDAATYSMGIYNGNGVDLDGQKGDNDDGKELAVRLFVQPFRRVGPRWLEGLYLAGGGTWEGTSIPLRRFETRGMMAPDSESLIFRWRTDQVLGTNGRNTDSIAATIDSKSRAGAELHYLRDSFTFSAEWAAIHYKGISVYHDLFEGTKRIRHDLLSLTGGSPFELSGSIQAVSFFGSWFLTGEKKSLDAFGWRQPTPRRPIVKGQDGWGALEILARASRIWVPDDDHALFTATSKVTGFAPEDDTGIKGPLPAAGGATVTAVVLDGARELHEATFGLNWTINYHARLLLDYTYLFVPDFDDATKTGGLVSGGSSENSDPTTKNSQVGSAHFFGARLIMRI
ncbi:MAG: porin [Pseudomonadota bacterium]